MKVSKKIVGISLASALALSATASFAAMPVNTVIVNDKAYSFNYFNNNLAPKLDVAKAIEAQDPIYVKIGSLENPTYYNVISKSFADALDVPAVTYYADNGVTTPYEAGDTESDNEAAIAAALDAVDDAVTGEELLAALQDETLGLKNVVADNAADYILDSVDFYYAADSAADPIADSVAALQAAVDATNARIDVNKEAAKGVGNEVAVRNGVTAFVQAKLDLGNIDKASVDAFKAYMAYDSEEKLAVAKIVIGVWNDKTKPYGFYDNADMVYHEHNNGLLSIIEEIDSWIDGINNALEFVDPAVKATEVEKALNNIPASLAVGSTNPNAESDYVYDPYYNLSPENTDLVVAEFIANAPVEGFTSLAGILGTLDDAIATVTAE